MPKFKYIGGTTASEHFNETSEGPIDEAQGVEMPDSTTVFGIKFIVNQPVDVTPEKFPNQAAYRHAVMKLKGNKYFVEAAEVEEAKFEEIEPDKPIKRRGRPPRQAGPEASLPPIVEAAE